jgi:predicted dehydrogenase
MAAGEEMENVRLGVIGLGMIGRVHAETLHNLEGCTLTAVSDVDAKHQEAAEELGTKFYPTYQEMIEKESLEGVVIAVPNEMHLPVGRACAEKGLHVLMEKPIAANLSDADGLVKAARENRVHLLIGHHRRYNPLIETVREAVRGGKIGKLVGVTILWTLFKPPEYFEGPFSWRSKKGAGPILINLIHEIDNLRYICGEVTRVYAEVSKKTRKFPVEDTVSVSLRLENDALASIFLSDTIPGDNAYEATTGENPFFYHSPETCYYFFGTEGTIKFPGMRKLFYPDPSKRGWQYPLWEEGMKVTREDPYARQLRHFCRVIRGEEEPRVSGEDGRKTLEVTLAVQRSGEMGEPVLLK